MDLNTREKLIDLQKIIHEKACFEEKLETLPKKLNDNIEILNKLKQNFRDKNLTLQRKGDQIKRDNEKYSENEKKINLLEADLGVNDSNQRASELNEKERRELQVKEAELNKDLQKHQNEYDDLKEEIKSLENSIKEQEASNEKLSSIIDSDLDEIKKQLEKLTKEELSLVPDINKEIIYKFERIVKKKDGLAIVPIKKNVCTGCHIVLTSQFINDVRSDENILFCPHCSRVLFYEDTEESKENFSFDDSDVGGLSDLASDNLDD